jgi:hypothetical protein
MIVLLKKITIKKAVFTKNVWKKCFTHGSGSWRYWHFFKKILFSSFLFSSFSWRGWLLKVVFCMFFVFFPSFFLPDFPFSRLMRQWGCVIKKNIFLLILSTRLSLRTLLFSVQHRAGRRSPISSLAENKKTKQMSKFLKKLKKDKSDDVFFYSNSCNCYVLMSYFLNGNWINCRYHRFHL